MSRSYYTAYAFLGSALVLQSSVNFRLDREGPEHESLPDLVADHLKKALSSRLRTSVRLNIDTLYRARLIADYRPREAVNDRLAVESLKSATTIAKAIHTVRPTA